MASTSINGQLSAFIAPLKYQDLPDEVRTHARHLLMDALGCGLVGCTTPEGERVRRTVRAMGGATGDTAIWGTAERAPLPLAVMANSTAVHTREIDDFSLAYHAGSVVVPAAVGAAASVNASGTDLLLAIVAGYETSCRIGAGGAAPGVPGFLPFKKVGWHSTSLFGPFGAAAAVAKALNLDAEHFQSAIGIAGSCAAGTWAFNEDKSTNKRIHPGLASKSGVVAAFLAKEGITGPSQLFEADWGGFYKVYLHGGPSFPEHVIGELGKRWEILNAGFKPYSSCRRIHSSVDVAFVVMQKHGVKAEQVRRITIYGNRIHEKQLGGYPVRTVLEAQFSLPYTVAAALLYKSAGLDQYTEAALRRPEITPLAEKVQVKFDPSISDHGEPRLEFELNDGRTITEIVTVPKGHPRNPLTPEEVIHKFTANASLSLGESQAKAALAMIQDIEKLRNVNELVQLLIPASGASAKVA